VGFGGSEIGFEHTAATRVAEIVGRAIDLGVNVFDTASAYLGSEEALGRALGARRAEVVLFTKCGATAGFSRSDWSRDGILRHIEQSLRALRTDHVDVLQLHSCSAETLRRGDAIEGLLEAQRAGKTRFIGYSGDSEDARVALDLNVFDTLQTSINIADQEAIALTLPLAIERDVGVIAKRPIANAAWRYGDRQPEESYHVAYWKRLRNLSYDLGDNPSDLALRFTLSTIGVHTAIVGTTKPDRIEENLRIAARGPLTATELSAIRERWHARSAVSWKGQT
jgi:aryl-alcohol dehydrogenase-like predicted oxidoreductase